MKKARLFEFPIKEKVLNFKSGKECFLVSNEDGGLVDKNDVDKIVKICNQNQVYEFLFKDKFGGKEYDEEKALGFVEWAARGWQNQEYFVFLIRSGNGEIVGALDIKSNDLAGGEIGYWADENNPGVMTNAVAKLIELAKGAGYQKLFALVREDNQKSKKVLMRNGFGFTKEVLRPEGRRMVFEKEL